MSDMYVKHSDVLEVCEWYRHEYAECEAALPNLTNEMQRLHPADVVERKKGAWRVDMWLTTKGYSCSECNCFTTKPSCFCPDCGADMRGET